MKIKKVLNTYRNDFWALYECEHCGFTMQKIAYDSANYRYHVVPRMKCPMCHKTTDELISKAKEGKVRC